MCISAAERKEMKQTMKYSQNANTARGQEAKQGHGTLQACGDVCYGPETPHWALQKEQSSPN